MRVRTIAAAVLLAMTTAAFADAVDDVRRTELAFAKAFADRDKAKFFSFVLNDATFLSGGRTLQGKEQVVASWSRFFEGPQAPFAWAPDRVSVSADGTLALSSGPVFDPDGNHAGAFMSTWRKQSDGTWKIVFDGSGPGPAVIDNVEEGDITTPDGVKLHYRKAGHGPALIAPLDYLLFDQLKQFADVATVITYDMRNRGRSSRSADTATWTIDQDVRDLETVRTHLKLEQFTPVGFSYLGKMVMLYAAAHPNRVRRIIQLAPLGNENVAAPADQDTGMPAEDLAKWQQLQKEGAIEKSPRDFCVAQWTALRYMFVGDPAHAAKFPIEATCALENEWPLNSTPVFEKLLASPHNLTAAELKTIAVPVLTLHGTSDRTSVYENGRNWAAQLPDARLITIPGAAHMLWLDDPVTLYAAMRSFLRGEWPLGSEKIVR
jgi:pimeloyl-ACP methyl ester carboxylesterase/ketosteroid isomerase-like protein